MGPVDSRVERAWRDLITLDTPGTRKARQLLIQRWTPARRRVPRWTKLRAELADLNVRIDDADAAHYVRNDLDAVRHANVVKQLTRRITQVQSVLADREPDIDTSPLNDPVFVEEKWRDTGYDGRRELLMLAWSKVVLAKAGTPGGHFDDRRITDILADTIDPPPPPSRP